MGGKWGRKEGLMREGSTDEKMRRKALWDKGWQAEEHLWLDGWIEDRTSEI